MNFHNSQRGDGHSAPPARGRRDLSTATTTARSAARPAAKRSDGQMPPADVAAGPAPLRLRTDGPHIITPDGQQIMLAGVNMYLEWYRRYHVNAVHDVKNLRTTIPAANVVRFVALLWHDSHGGGDGIECSSDDEAFGYLQHYCWHFIEAAIQQMTNAGLWVIVTARLKYAAGYTWPDDPDVFHDEELKRKFLAMWRWVATRLSGMDRIAGYEIMSEPRTRSVRQRDVMAVMAEGCDEVAKEDPHALCIVGPAPYYKVWTFEDDADEIALPGPKRDNVVYTFDFFVPKVYVMSNTGSELDKDREPPEFPDEYSCKNIYDTWWRGRCGGWDDEVMVDAAFIASVMRRIPVRLRERLQAPVYCNQWGVKDEVWTSKGRLAYANAMLDTFATEGIHSTYWIWRSYAKGGRDVDGPECMLFALALETCPWPAAVCARVLAALIICSASNHAVVHLQGALSWFTIRVANSPR